MLSIMMVRGLETKCSIGVHQYWSTTTVQYSPVPVFNVVVVLPGTVVLSLLFG
jgi:hypothetical protein